MRALRLHSALESTPVSSSIFLGFPDKETAIHITPFVSSIVHFTVRAQLQTKEETSQEHCNSFRFKRPQALLS